MLGQAGQDGSGEPGSLWCPKPCQQRPAFSRHCWAQVPAPSRCQRHPGHPAPPAGPCPGSSMRHFWVLRNPSKTPAESPAASTACSWRNKAAVVTAMSVVAEGRESRKSQQKYLQLPPGALSCDTPRAHPAAHTAGPQLSAGWVSPGSSWKECCEPGSSQARLLSPAIPLRMQDRLPEARPPAGRYFPTGGRIPLQSITPAEPPRAHSIHSSPHCLPDI